MDEEELKKRTKRFGLRIMKLVAGFQTLLRERQWVGSLFGRVLLLALITGLLAALVQGQSLLLDSVL
jgi:hypothetical protein